MSFVCLFVWTTSTCSGFTPGSVFRLYSLGGAQEPICSARDQTHDSYMKGKYSIHCIIAPDLSIGQFLSCIHIWLISTYQHEQKNEMLHASPLWFPPYVQIFKNNPVPLVWQSVILTYLKKRFEHKSVLLKYW